MLNFVSLISIIHLFWQANNNTVTNNAGAS